jgi:hypothetical protein
LYNQIFSEDRLIENFYDACLENVEERKKTSRLFFYIPEMSPGSGGQHTRTSSLPENQDLTCSIKNVLSA